MFALFVDTTNAFGSVSHRVIWSLLRAYGLPELDVQFLEKLYHGNSFAVSGPFGKTAEISTHAGVNQGDITSPLIWNLVINALLRYLHGARQGYTHQSGVMTSSLAYIDDAVIMSDSAHGFRTLLFRLNRFYAWAGLQVNNAKSAVFAHDFATNTSLPTFHFRLQHRPIPPLPLHGTYKYLGLEFSPGGRWAVEKARVRRKLRDCIAALKGSPYLPNQLDRVVRACMLPIFRYGSALVDWTDRELDEITRIWANARRLAWKLAPGTPTALHTLAGETGGGGIPHAKLLWAKEIWGLLQTCTAHEDVLKTLTHWEWNNSMQWVGVDDEQAAARELTCPIIAREVQDVSNRFRRVCKQLGTSVSWPACPHPEQQRVDDFNIAGVTRQVRSSSRTFGESKMWDATNVALQFNKALRVLTRHGVRGISQLTYPQGQWFSFQELPQRVREDKGWSADDYTSLLRCLTSESPRPVAVRTAQTGDERQMTGLPGPIPVPSPSPHQTLCHGRQVPMDPLGRRSGRRELPVPICPSAAQESPPSADRMA